MLSVSEIFHSIQGEGPRAGYPVVFLRTAGCNLRCTWCDTPDALELRQGKRMETDEIVAQIQSYDCPHLVITGGEPMLQQAELKKVLDQLEGYYVEVETNGGFASILDDYINHYNCSPKLAGSGNKPYELKLLPNQKTWYKFVIDSEEDLVETLKYIDQHDLPKDRIRFMPQGQTPEESREKSLWLIGRCKDLGIIFNPRLHILLWGNTPGT